MKKYQSLLLPILILSIALCGCGNTIPEMSETDNAMITEYATHLLVKYSSVSDRALLNDKQLELETAKEEEEAERLRKTKEIEQAYLQATQNGQQIVDVDSEVTDKTEKVVENIPQKTVSEFFVTENIDIEYTSAKLCDSYPDESSEEVFMAMDATEGNQLCVITFDVKNISSSEQELNMLDKQGEFSIRMEDGSVIPAQSTLLLDDLSSYMGTLAADSEQEMVLVFEVPDTVSQVGAIDLLMSNQSGENVLTLK